MKKAFSFQSSNLWVNILTFILGAVALAGVELPTNPNSISLDIVNTLSSSGVIAVIGIVLINVANPIYHAVIKSSFNFKAMVGSPNFWINAGSLGASLLVLVGLEFPNGTIEQIVGAIYSKDYSALLFVLFSNVMNPLIRWFRDRKAEPVPAA